MADTHQPDHDQRLKVLLKEFFEQFFQCFFPEWAERFDFASVHWEDKEVFLDPPRGEKRVLDLVAKVGLKPDVESPREGMTELLALIHIEVERRRSATALRSRMYEYFVQLERDFGLPVLPIGVLLQVGLDGIGWDAHELHFWNRRVLRFEYAYVGLPALDAEKYLEGEQILGVALSTLMKVPPDRRAELYAEGLQRIATSGENDYRQYLLAECLEEYSDLNEAEKLELDKHLESENKHEGKSLMTTTFDRGFLAGERNTLLLALERRFGELDESVRLRVEEMQPDQLRQALFDLVDGATLDELGLQAKPENGESTEERT